MQNSLSFTYILIQTSHPSSQIGVVALLDHTVLDSFLEISYSSLLSLDESESRVECVHAW